MSVHGFSNITFATDGGVSAKPRFLHHLAVGAALSVVLMTPAYAQVDEEPFEDEIISTGTIQQTIEKSIDFKRSQTVVSDALIGAELGDLPDLSVAESLERIVGVTSDRFKGGASELSVRGLGAFLGSSVLNGREITSGSDGRDVNFGQFPSELVNGALVYKTQQADFIEGGVSGIIELQTLRPLDYNKRRLQVQGLLGYSDYEARVDGGDPWSERLTGSYVDQFKDTGIGDIGIAIGGQLRRDTAAEDIYTSSSSYRPCSTIEGQPRSNGSNASNNCRYSESNGDVSGPSDVYFISNQYIYRAQATEADRDSVMGNIQWQPTGNLDINLDAQWSDRLDVERRANLVIADGRRDITPIEISPTGALMAWSGETRLENQSVYRTRAEEYVGLGGTVEWSRDKWTIAADVGYSKTERRQDELDMRIRTNDRVLFELDSRGVDIPNLTLTDVSAVENRTGLTFDLNNHDIYTNGARARRRLENIDDKIFSVRLDFDREIAGDSLFTNLAFGGRFAERSRINDDGIDATIGGLAGYDSAGAIAARRDTFLVENLYEDADTAMQGLSFATWDPETLFVALTGDADAGLPTGSTLSTQDADITETTLAMYLMADFETGVFGLPAYGNIGARIIKTDIDSIGVSSAITTAPSVTDVGNIAITLIGDPSTNLEENRFINVLPSANLVLELADDKILRFAAYSAIARPDPGDMSAALSIDNNPDGFASLNEAISASGNPQIEPLESVNFDVSYEWYPSDASIVSVAGYYKNLRTGFENVSSTLDVNADGGNVPITILRSSNTDESSRLFGFELAVQHKLTNLGGFLGGFGIQGAYNFVDSDFETPDPTATDSANPLANFTQPANISGYSKHTGNVTVFWENDDFDIRLAYKARSSYYKPFRISALRFTGAQDFLDASMSYDITDNLEIRAQALNLTNEPNVFFRPTADNLAQADYSGRRYFVGMRARF